MRKQKSKRRIIKSLCRAHEKFKSDLAKPLTGPFGPCQGIEPLFYKGIQIVTEQDENTLYRVEIQK